GSAGSPVTGTGGASTAGGSGHAGGADDAGVADSSSDGAGESATGSGGGDTSSDGSPSDAENDGSSAMPLTGPGHVRSAEAGGTFTLLRDDQPYYIRGINGQAHMDLAARDGANSTHTYGSDNAGTVLDDAQSRGMTVMLGIDLTQEPGSYADEGYKNDRRAVV